MGDAYKGLTIRIGADTRPLNSAINSIKSAAGSAQSALNALKKASQLDPSNAKVMAKSLDLMGDKAKLEARQFRTLQNSIRKTAKETTKLADSSGKPYRNMQKAAASIKDIYAQTERMRTSFTNTNAQLETVYDTLKQIARMEGAVQSGVKFNKGDAEKYVESLRKELAKGGDEAVRAREKLEALFRAGTGEKHMASLMKQLGFDEGDANAMLRYWERLRNATNQYQEQLEELNRVSGFRRAQSDMAAAEARVRGLSSEYAKMTMRMNASNISPTFERAARAVSVLDENMQRARANTERANATYQQLPKSMEAARAKMRAIQSESSLINEKMRTLGVQLKELRASSAFDSAAASSKNVYTNLSRAEQQVADMNYGLRMAQTRAEGFKDALAQARLTNSASADKIKEMETQLKNASVSANMFADKLRSAEAVAQKWSVAAKVRETRTAMRALNAESDKLRDMSTHTRALGKIGAEIRTMGYGLYSTLTPAIMMAGTYAVQKIDDVDTAYRDMRKTVNGSEEQFEALKKSAVDYSRTHVTSADTLLEIQAMGGQLGIATDNLDAFSKTVSNLDIATNMSSDDIAEDLGKMASVMGINADEYDNFGDSLVRLGNNMPVMESDIMNMTTRWMGMGKIVGMSADQMLGWSAAASATGQKSEAAGSSMQRFISGMETAVVKGGDSLDKYAKVAGMSSDAFKKSFSEDASGTMYRFIEGLGKIQEKGGSVNQTLVDLGINNVRDKQLLEGFAQQMANGSSSANTLHDSLKMSSDAYHGLATTMSDGSIEQAGDAAREAGRKSEGFSGELQILKNNVTAMALELGDGLFPLLKDANGVVQDATGWLKGVDAGTKQFASTAALAVAALGPVTVGFGSFVDGLSKIHSLVSKFPTAWASIAAGAKVVGSLPGTMATAAAGATGFGGKIRAAGSAAVAAASSFRILKVAMAGIGIGLAITAVSSIVTAFEEGRQKVEATEKAVSGMKNAVNDNITAMKGESAATNKINSGLATYQDYIDAAAGSHENFLNTQSQLVDSTNQITASYQDMSGQLEEAKGILEDTVNKEHLSITNQGLLRGAVAKVNELTGTHYKVVDATNGVISDSSGKYSAAAAAAGKYRDAIMKNIAAKEQEAKVEAQTQTLKNAYSAYSSAAQDYSKQQLAIKETQAQMAAIKQQQEDIKNDDSLNPFDKAAKVAALGQTYSDLSTKLQTELIPASNAAQSSMDSNKKSVEAATNALKGGQAVLNGTATAWDKLANAGFLDNDLMEKGQSMDNLKSAMKDLGMSADQLYDIIGKSPSKTATFAAAFDGSADSVKLGALKVKYGNDQLAASLSQSGVHWATFAAMGKSQMDRLSKACDGDANKMVAALQKVDGKDLKGKHLKVTDDGTIKVVANKAQQLDSKKFKEKTIKVSSKGIDEVQNKAGKTEAKLTKLAKGYHVVVKEDGSARIISSLSDIGKKEKEVKKGTITIDDNGTIHVAQDQIDKLFAKTKKGAKGKVSAEDDGSTKKAKDDLDKVDESAKKTSTKKVKTEVTGADDAKSKLDNITKGTATKKIKVQLTGSGDVKSQIKALTSGTSTKKVRVRLVGSGSVKSQIKSLSSGTSTKRVRVRLTGGDQVKSQIKSLSSGTSTKKIRVSLTGAAAARRSISSITRGTSVKRIRVSVAGAAAARRSISSITRGTSVKRVRVSMTGAGAVRGQLNAINASAAKAANKRVRFSENGYSGVKSKLSSIDTASRARTKTVSIYANDNASGTLRSINGLVNSLHDRTITVTTNYVSRGHHASGGVFPASVVPSHADGGITGIVTRRMLTNIGEVGEAGAEAVFSAAGSSAIVPLSNRQYVRPFARAVAAEMPDRGGGTTVVNNYSINGMTVSPESALAEAMDVVFSKASRLERM